MHIYKAKSHAGFLPSLSCASSFNMHIANINLTCVPALLAVLAFFSTYASGSDPGLSFQLGDDALLDSTDYNASAPNKPIKPNILFIITDDQGDQSSPKLLSASI